MRKILDFIILIITTLLIILFFYIKNFKENNFEKILYTAEQYFSQELYDDAIILFKKAKKIKNSEYIDEKIIKSYIKKDDVENIKNIIQKIKPNSENYKIGEEYILSKYIEDKKYREYNEYLKNKNTETIQKYNKLYFNKFIEYEKTFKNIKMNPKSKYFVGHTKEKEDIYNTNQKIVGESVYKNIKFYDDEHIIAKKNNEKYQIYDLKNNKKSNFKFEIEYPYKNEYIVIKEKNKYYYADRLGNRKSEFYEYASNFNDNKAIIKINETYNIVNEKFEIVKKLSAKAIKVDEYNNAIFDDYIIILNKGEKLYNIKNSKESNSYDEIDYPRGGLIAVKSDRKWGYINNNFENVIYKKYENAKSFTCEIGIVKDNNFYKMINDEGKTLYEDENEILQFNIYGISFIKNDEGYKMIKLLRYIYD